MSGRHTDNGDRSSLERISSRYGLPVLVFGAVSLLAVLGFWVLDGNGFLIGMTLFVIVVGAALVWPRSRRRRLGTLDRETALVLDDLMRAGFGVMHQLRLADIHLQHVVVGPPGVFAVGTEPGTERSRNGDSPETSVSNSIGTLRERADRLSSRIGTPVTPLLVTPTPLDVDVPRYGQIVAVDELEDFFRSRPPLLEPAAVREAMREVFSASRAEAREDRGSKGDASSA